MLKKWLFLLGVVLICACSGKKLSQDNFHKIKNNMSVAEVTNILGKPTETTIKTLGPITARSLIWKTKNSSIIIGFIDNKVVKKHYDNQGASRRTGIN